jgi:hypothetical protein
VAVTDSGQRLHAEEETVVKPLSAGGAGDTVRIDSVQSGEQQVERDVKGGDQRSKLRPAQSKQPVINLAPLPAANIDLNKLDLASMDRNAVLPPFR